MFIPQGLAKSTSPQVFLIALSNLGVMRAGLLADAEQELKVASKQSPLAQRLLKQLQQQ